MSYCFGISKTWDDEFFELLIRLENTFRKKEDMKFSSKVNLTHKGLMMRPTRYADKDSTW